MERKMKRNRFEEYEVVTKTLKFGTRKYKVKTNLYGDRIGGEPHHEWNLNKTQALGLLKECPEKFQIKRLYHFDGMTDGTEYDHEEFEPLTPERLEYVINQITMFHKTPYSFHYNEDTKTFKIACHYLSAWDLPVEGVELI